MAASTFPALSINTQGESPLNTFAKIEQIKSAQQSQQMGEIQLQEARLKQQSQQVIMQAWTANNGDPDKTMQAVVNSGKALPEDVVNLQTHFVDLKTKAAILSEDQLKVQTEQNGILYNALKGYQALPVEQRTPEALKGVMSDLAGKGIPIDKYVPVFQKLAQDSSDATLKPLEIGLVGQDKVYADEKALREEASAPTVVQAKQKTQLDLQKLSDEAAMAHIAMLSQPSPEFAASQHQAELQATRAKAAEAFAAAAKTKAETALMGQKPVFATDPATNQRVAVPMAEAVAKNFTDRQEVSRGDIAKEEEATAQTVDVQRRLSNYKVAFQNAGNLSVAEQQSINALISEGVLSKLPVVGHVLEPFDKAGQNYLWKKLRPEARDLVSSYISLESSMLTLQKAETQNRPSGEGLRLDVAAIPSPGEGPTVGSSRLDKIQNVIDAVSRGQVHFRYIPTTQSVRNEVEGHQESNPALEVQKILNQGKIPSNEAKELFTTK